MSEIILNEEVKKKWVAALRSGEYKQGRGALRKVDDKGVDRFCCLGVLCDIYAKDKVGTEKWNPPDRRAGYDQYSFTTSSGVDDFSMPPDNVNVWAGLNGSFWGDLQIKASRSVGSLYDLNDRGSPFNKIADYIEEQL